MSTLKVGDRIKFPTRKTIYVSSFEDFNREHIQDKDKEWKIAKHSSLGGVELRVNGILCAYNFMLEDLDAWDEEVGEAPAYKGIHLVSLPVGYEPLIDAFRQQVLSLKLGYKMCHGMGIHSLNEVFYLNESQPWTKECKTFDLRTQYAEALEYVKTFAKQQKPLSLKYSIAGQSVVLSKDKVTLNGREETITYIQKIYRDFSISTSAKVFGYDVYTPEIKIGCTHVSLSDIKELIDFHKKSF